MENLEQIIKDCQKDNKQAQKQLYELLSPQMFGICRRYAQDFTEAEDILHDGFVKIFMNISKYSFSGSFKGWASRIIINCALERFRKKKMLFTNIEPIQETIATSESSVLEQLSNKELLEIVQTLSPQYKTVFNLYAIEGYSHKEISKILGISEGTSKSNLWRARAFLQKKVKALYTEKNEKYFKLKIRK